MNPFKIIGVLERANQRKWSKQRKQSRDNSRKFTRTEGDIF